MVWGQLPAYTLYYTNPLAINPAFAGSAYKLRGGINFRTQYTNFTSSLLAYSLFADNYFDQINSGAGLSVYTDNLGAYNFRTTQVAGYYSYNAKLADALYFKAGAQISWTQNGYEAGDLTFNDQITFAGPTGTPTAETLPIGSKRSYVNATLGVLLTARQFWIGASGYNLLKPRAGYTNESKLPIGFGVQTGIKLWFAENTVGRKIEKKERFVMPTAMVSLVGVSKQLHLGTEVVYDPFTFGAMIRGNFFSSAQGTSNMKSFAVTVGIRTGFIQSNYVYEIPFGKNASLVGPSHELSLRALLKMWQRPTRRKIERLELF